MPKLTLISFKICPFVQRSVILLKEKGIDYDIKFINPYEPPEWFKKISPTGKVPVLLVDDQPLFESAVINEYLDEVYPPSLHPADPFKKAQNRAWMEYTSPMNMSFFNMIMTKDKEEGSKVKEAFLQQLAGLDKVATHAPWFNGDDFSMVDISAAPVFTRLEFLKKNFDLDLLDGFANLQRWSTALLARKSIADSMIEDFDELMLMRLKDSGSYLLDQAQGGVVDKQTRTEIEAAAWRKMLSHFQKRTDVQNIDLMNMAGFCRNCFSKWYMAEAKKRGVDMDYDEARKVVYGMPYDEYKEKYQTRATDEQMEKFNAIKWGEDTTE